MKRSKLIISLCAAVLLGILAWAWLAPAGLGDSPEITLLTIDGEQLPLAKLRGNPLLLVFWATNCPGCIKEMPHLVELYDELSPRGLEIVAVAMRYDKPSNVLSMRNSRNIPYPVALDLDGAAALAFGDVRMTPTSFLMGPNGRIVFQKTGMLDMETLRDDIILMLQQTAMHRPDTAGNATGS